MSDVPADDKTEARPAEPCLGAISLSLVGRSGGAPRARSGEPGCQCGVMNGRVSAWSTWLKATGLPSSTAASHLAERSEKVAHAFRGQSAPVVADSHRQYLRRVADPPAGAAPGRQESQ